MAAGEIAPARVRQSDPEVAVHEADESGAVEAGARARPAVAIRSAEEVASVRDHAIAERPGHVMRVRPAVLPAPRQVDSRVVAVAVMMLVMGPDVMSSDVMSSGPLARAGGAALQRPHECKHQGQGNGEQQYEEANRPQESG